jgi:periplasmic protein TonB
VNQSARIESPNYVTSSVSLDEPWRRFGWIIPAALLVWAALLTAFALLLETTAPPPPALAPAEVRIIELPPTGGLQGGPAPAKPKTEPVKPRSHVIRRPPTPRAETHRLPKPTAAPEVTPSVNGTAKASAEAPVETGPVKKNAVETPSGGIPGGTGSGTGSGIGSDSGGARAIFAPKPVIPNDLREQVFQAVAVAHFKVSYGGNVQVTLTTPTQSPRLNELLLETLKQWRFFPAMKNGVAIDSEFNVRIPISVQ